MILHNGHSLTVRSPRPLVHGFTPQNQCEFKPVEAARNGSLVKHPELLLARSFLSFVAREPQWCEFLETMARSLYTCMLQPLTSDEALPTTGFLATETGGSITHNMH